MASQKVYGKPLNFKTKKAQTIRMVVYARDKFTCAYCGKVATIIPQNYTGELTLPVKGGWLEIDHIVPRFSGGSNDVDNLKTSCNSCNASKGVD